MFELTWNPTFHWTLNCKKHLLPWQKVETLPELLNSHRWNVAFPRATTGRLAWHTRLAIANVSSSSCSSGTTLLTRPCSKASWAEMGVPVNSISMATWIKQGILIPTRISSLYSTKLSPLPSSALLCQWLLPELSRTNPHWHLEWQK